MASTDYHEKIEQLCRYCRNSNVLIYPKGPSTSPRLPEHTVCADCGRVMEQVPDLSKIHVVTAKQLTDQWSVDSASVVDALGKGLRSYQESGVAFYYSDHLELHFEKPERTLVE